MTNNEAIEILNRIRCTIHEDSLEEQALVYAISALTEQRWIPCSERLPEMTHFTQDVNPFSDDVLVTIRNEYGSKCLLIGFFDSQHGWLFSDQQPIDGFTWKPIAWQPLPDPYKKEGDRNE